MEHIDEYLLKRSWLGWGIHMFVLDKENRRVAASCGGMACPEKKVAESLRIQWKDAQIPVLYFDEKTYFYMGFQKDAYFYVLGPVSWKRRTAEEQRKYLLKHRLSKTEIAFVSVKTAVSALSTVSTMITGQCYPEEDIFANAARVGELAMKDEELGTFVSEMSGAGSFSYQDVQQYVRILESGTMHITTEDFLKNEWQVDLIGDYAKKNERKRYEYMILQALILIRQAAVNSGVSEKISFERINQYIAMLADSENIPEMLHIYVDAVNHMEELIRREQREKRSGELSEQCKRYIARNIRKKITLSDLAESLNRNPAYLSRMFAEQEGIPLTQYIRQEKMRVAANLIRNSNESMKVIAEYLSIQSESKFAQQFKEVFGVTPVEYRRRNRK